MKKKLNSVRFVLFAFFVMIFLLPLFPISDLYDRIGIISEHGLHGAVPEENVDLFNGNLTLKFQDIRLPGPNGFDTVVWRVYNSKLFKDNLAIFQPDEYRQSPLSWVGIGWSMHMGRLHNFSGLIPSVEYPDGRSEGIYFDKPSADISFYTPSFAKYDPITFKLHFKNGTVWTFGGVKQLYDEMVRVVTLIEDSYGNQISVEYGTEVTDSCIKKITDSMGRTIDFTVSNGRLSRITVKNTTGVSVYYDYTVDTFGASGFNRLVSFKAPEIPACSFEYDDGLNFNFELTAMNTAYGGRLEYLYDEHLFYHYVYAIESRVVTQKKIRFSASESFNTWTYTYPTYNNAPEGTVVVNGPLYTTNATFFGYSASNPWKIGLLKTKWFTDGSYTEENEWEQLVISPYESYIIDVSMGLASAPLQKKRTVTRLGDAVETQEFLYERDGVKKFGMPTKIKYYGGASGTTLQNYKTLDYYFETNTTYKNMHMLDFISKETVYDSSNSKLSETQTDYFDVTGKYGAVDSIKRWRAGSEYLIWDYTYSSTNPNLVTITINLPGTAGIETHKFSYGVESEVSYPDYTEFERTVSAYDSSVKSEVNRHGITMNFTYDNLGRIKTIDLPSEFNNIGAAWSANSVTITQGSNSVTKYWDGLGRDLGFTETGDGTTLYNRKTLDSEGRVLSESKGSNSASDLYSYLYNALGNPTKITDPHSKITTIAYTTNVKTVTDPRTNQSVFTYAGFPGKFTKLKDPLNEDTVYTYDGAGRLKSAVFNAERTQSYTYNGLSQVKSETHPETGTISYTYDSKNNLNTKVWGSVTHTYLYNDSNQLESQASGEETISYTYDTLGRVNAISSDKGWKREEILYNGLGSITHEKHTIPGLTAKTVSYTYDLNNNPKTVTYPDGKVEIFTYNGLNMPETVVFNSKSLISAVSYGILKQPTAITISGNTTAFGASYTKVGGLYTVSLKKGATTYYAAEYGYDDVGNITGVTNTTPSFNSTFGYDDVNRLTSANYTGGKLYNYEYDTYGNLKIAKENNIQVFSKTFNAKNQPTDSNYVYDTRGNMTKEPGYIYEWNKDNVLVNVKDSTGLLLSSHTYNERGLRMSSRRYPEPAITMISPNGGEKWTQLQVYPITWSSAGVVGNVKIEYSKDNGTTWTSIIASTPNNGSYSWTVPNTIESALCLLRIGEIDGNPVDVSNAVFTITPTITVTSPNGGELWEQGSAHPITWTSVGTVGNVKIDYSKDNGVTWTSIIASTPNNGSYSWTVPSTFESDICLIRVSHVNGIAFDVSNAVFAIQKYLSLRLISPNGGEIWAAGSIQTITWNSPGTYASVNLEYTGDNGNHWKTITLSTPDTGSYAWTVPITSSVKCMVRIAAGFLNSSPKDTSDGLFVIVDNTPYCGKTWVNGTGSGSEPLTSVTYGNSLFEAVGSNGTIYSSATGKTWTYRAGFPNTPLNSVAYGNNMFIAVGGSGAIIKSADGYSWQAQTAITIETLRGVCWGLDRFVAVGDNGTILTSVDGIDWVQQTSGVLVSLFAVTYGNNQFVIVGENGLIMKSLDGIDWELQNSRTLNTFYSIAYGENKFIAVGSLGTIAYSFDGIDWTPRTLAVSNDLIGITHGEGEVRFVITGRGGTVVTGLEGIKGIIWTIQALGITNDLYGAVYGNGKYIAVGTGKSMYSNCPVPTVSSFRVTAPNSGENYIVGSSHEIMWTSVGNISNVKLDYSTNNGTSWITVISSTANTGRYMWTVPNTLSTTCLVRVSGVGVSSYGVCERPFSIIPSPVEKTITVTSPNGGESWTCDSIHNITWTSTGTIGKVSIDYSINGGAEWIPIVDTDPDDGSYTWTVPSITSVNCLIRVKNCRPGEPPIDESDNSFQIGYNLSMMKNESDGGINRAAGAYTVSSDYPVGVVQAASYTDTYYIYSFDGKLLAEYNQAGSCEKDYIYMGSRLVAEYQPLTAKYYYYMSDQINSTRIVTDDAGNVVYSSANGPYGDIQKTWNKTFDPKQKFSGKEREVYSGLDYFGARYYSNKSYRFNSVDPIMFRKDSLVNPQLWNLYAYCRNNPILWIDPTGLDTILGIHSTASENASISDGHAYISVYDTKTGEYNTYSLWAGKFARNRGDQNAPKSDVRKNIEKGDKNYTPEYSRYYKLTPAQESKLAKILATPDQWSLTHSCAEWASEVIMGVIGEDVDSDDNFGFETPREVSKSIKELEKMNPTSESKPHK